MYRPKKGQSQMTSLEQIPEGISEDHANLEGGAKSPTRVVIFYAPWCGHCKKMLEGTDATWQKLKARHGQRKDVSIEEVNGDESPEQMTKYGVVNYPTILKLNNDKVTKYNGDRTLESLEAFIN